MKDSRSIVASSLNELPAPYSPQVATGSINGGGHSDDVQTSDYDTHSSVQLEANARNLQPLAQALLAVSALRPPITIADFGSATGLNSMKTFSTVVKAFRETDGKEIFVFHVDLPNNAWNILFKNGIESPDSYLTLPGTYISAIGRSYFDRLFPSNFLSIGYSTFSLHWLSRTPASSQQLRRCSADDADLMNEIKEIARGDIEQFLAHRVEELIVGGRLIIKGPMMKYELASCYHVLSGMVSSGICSDEYIDSFQILWYFRTEEDYAESIRKFPQLRVLEQTVTEEPDPLFRKYQQDGDVQAFAEARIKMSRVMSEMMFRALFKGNQQLIDEFYERLTEYCREHIEPLFPKQLLLVIEKTV